MAGDAECLIGEPKTAQRRVAALMAAGLGCGTRKFIRGDALTSKRKVRRKFFDCQRPDVKLTTDWMPHEITDSENLFRHRNLVHCFGRQSTRHQHDL
jgi:hypothetical protein